MTPTEKAERERADRLIAALKEGTAARKELMRDGPAAEIAAQDAANARTADALAKAFREASSVELRREIGDHMLAFADHAEVFRENPRSYSEQAAREPVAPLLTALWEGIDARERLMHDGPAADIAAQDAANARTADALAAALRDATGDLREDISDTLLSYELFMEQCRVTSSRSPGSASTGR
jgi:hypothetical protein